MPAQEYTPENQTSVRHGDLRLPADQQALLTLLDLYARRLPGHMQPLPSVVAERLVPALLAQPGCRLFLADTNGQATGLAVCFDGFSTFQAKPLLNIHDLAVHPQFQRQGIGDQLLAAVIAFAQQADYCAVTLEVAADNPARRLYTRHGFQSLSGPSASHLTLFGKLELCSTRANS